MIARQPLTIGQYAAEYSLLHPIRQGTARQLAISAALFERWSGAPVPLAELDERQVARWLREMEPTRSAATVRSKRVAIMVLWRAAADEGLCDPPVIRIRVARAPAASPQCWTHAEVAKIADACRSLRRRHRCGLSRATWWRLAVSVAWDTGLRWGDQVALPVSAIQADGSAWVVQAKTGTPQLIRLGAGTLSLLRESLEECPRALVCPWPASHEAFAQQFRRILTAAGLSSGSWKWLRRSSATDAERQEPGAGARQLGHRPGSRVAAVHYLDQRICGSDWRRPAPIDAG